MRANLELKPHLLFGLLSRGLALIRLDCRRVVFFLEFNNVNVIRQCHPSIACLCGRLVGRSAGLGSVLLGMGHCGGGSLLFRRRVGSLLFRRRVGSLLFRRRALLIRLLLLALCRLLDDDLDLLRRCELEAPGEAVALVGLCRLGHAALAGTLSQGDRDNQQ